MMKLATLKDADWLHDPALKAVLNALRASGGKARIAGGAVRDGLVSLKRFGEKHCDGPRSLLRKQVRRGQEHHYYQ